MRLKILIIFTLCFTIISCKTKKAYVIDNYKKNITMKDIVNNNKTIDDFIIKSVVQIYSKFSSGSGFLVSKKVSDHNEKRKIYLVTNKHVLGNYTSYDEFIPNKSIEVRLYLKANGYEYVRLSSDLLDENGHKFYKLQIHPDPRVDIAVLDITKGLEAFQKSGIDISDFATIDVDNLLDINEVERTTNTSMGDLVFAMGYPKGIKIETTNEPIAKAIHISSRIDGKQTYKVQSYDRKKILKEFILDKKFFLVDGKIINGNSGGPVIVPRNHKLLSMRNTDTYRTLEVDNHVIGIVASGRLDSGIYIIYACDYAKEIIENFNYPDNFEEIVKSSKTIAMGYDEFYINYQNHIKELAVLHPKYFTNKTFDYVSKFMLWRLTQDGSYEIYPNVGIQNEIKETINKLADKYNPAFTNKNN